MVCYILKHHNIFIATAVLYSLLCSETIAYLQPLQVSMVCCVQRPQHIYSKLQLSLVCCVHRKQHIYSQCRSLVCYVQTPQHIYSKLQFSLVCYAQRPQHIYSHCRSLWFAMHRYQSKFKTTAGLYTLLYIENIAYLQPLQVSIFCYV